jgi:hypothetical protein
MVGETCFSKSKGKKKKMETKKNNKAAVIGVSEAKSKAKGICFYCKEDEHWMIFLS